MHLRGYRLFKNGTFLQQTIIIMPYSFLGLSNSPSAQTVIWSVQAAKYVGKIVKFDESVFRVDYNPASKICRINMADPDVANSPVITVIIHNVRTTRHINWLKALEIQTITVTGRLLQENGKFVINGNDSHTRIEPEKGGVMIDPPPEPPTSDTTQQKQK
jgi:hypothetical protein